MPVSHPDLLLVEPEDRQNKIDEIRLIDDALSFRPFEGRKRLLSLNDADTMNIASANANFFKTSSKSLLTTARPYS